MEKMKFKKIRESLQWPGGPESRDLKKSHSFAYHDTEL
jgi:hypothetical protein